MNCENIKFMSRKTKLAQVDSFMKLNREVFEKNDKLLKGIKTMISGVALTDVEKEADRLYELIKKERKIASIKIPGLYDRNYTKRLFTALVQRHSDVKTREVQRRGDRKKIIEAWLGEEPKEKFADAIEDSLEAKLKKIMEGYVTKPQIAQATNISLEEAQKLISKLVAEKKIMQNPEGNGTFKWVEG
ncbi:MAG: hypothetical protein ABIH20_01780 [Candidatus Diapherotrites archaeon]